MRAAASNFAAAAIAEVSSRGMLGGFHVLRFPADTRKGNRGTRDAVFSMKQLILMIVLTLIGTVGVFTVTPFLGVAIYYLYAVLRPQYLWEWALPQQPWSFYVGVATLIAALGVPFGFFDSTVSPTAEPNTRLVKRGLASTHVAVLLFAFWVSLSYLTAFNRDVAYPFLIDYLKMFAMFAASIALTRTLRQVWALYLVATLAIGYIAYEINFEYLLKGYLNIYFSGYGGLDNNGAGLLLAMGVPLCLFAWEATRAKWRWVFLALIPVVLHAVLMSFSRGAMVSLLAVSPLFWLRSRRKRPIGAALLMVALLVPVLAGQEIRERFFTVGEYSEDRSAQSRFDSWRAGWRMAKDYPLLGVGIRNADLLSYKYGADMEGRVIHNQYLQTAADSGFLALAFYVGAFFCLWRNLSTVRKRTKNSADPNDQLMYSMANGIECSIAIFCVGAMFLYLTVLELTYLLLLLGGHLSLLVAASESAGADTREPVKTKPVQVFRPTAPLRPSPARVKTF